MIPKLEEAFGLTVTFNTTEDCNLRCTYCYEINKQDKHLNYELAKKFIDHLVSDEDYLDTGFPDSGKDGKCDPEQAGLIVDFIGGDAFMNVELVDKIVTYLQFKIMTTNTYRAQIFRRFWRISISTNGTLFGDPKVKAFIDKWLPVLSVGISIDGCPEIHDLNRVFPDGSGSLEIIKKHLPWFQSRFPNEGRSTKSTLAKSSIPYISKSLKYMHEELGLTNINQNFIMEDAGCNEEDYKLFDAQLAESVNYTYEHRNCLYWSMLDKEVFANHHLSEGEDWTCEGKCGSGIMPCLSIDGDIYPCFRWLPHTQTKADHPYKVGSADKGFFNPVAFKQVREGAYRANCTREEKCRTCEFESACSYCIGGCYSEFQDFVRTTYICEITKLQCYWAVIYWYMYDNEISTWQELFGFLGVNSSEEAHQRIQALKVTDSLYGD